jgi:CBS domain-containing protein
MRAADVMTRDVATVTPDTPLHLIADLLLSKHISGVPVVNADNTLAGVVSEADVMWRAAGEHEPHHSWLVNVLSGRALAAADFIRTHGTHAADIMTRDVVAVTEDTDLDDVLDLFEGKHIKRVPVVRDGKLVGIVSRKDLLRRLTRSLPETAAAGDDASLGDRLRALLAQQRWTDLGRVNVVVENGRARLSGLVTSEAERRALHVAAHSILGDVPVDDNLTVGAMPAGGI